MCTFALRQGYTGGEYMSLIRWSPFVDSFSEMDEIFKRLPSMGGANMPVGFVPAMDVYDTKDAVMVETQLAGVNPEEVEVNVEDGVLTVKGSSKKEHEVDDKNYYRREVRAGSFYRQVALPVPVKEDSVKAEFEDGVLKITCPKSEPKKANKVNVQVIKKNGKK